MQNARSTGVISKVARDERLKDLTVTFTVKAFLQYGEIRPVNSTPPGAELPVDFICPDIDLGAHRSFVTGTEE